MSHADYERWRTVRIESEPYLSVVVPTYNEETRILPTIGAIASHISGIGYPWGLIVSDDGSKDRTVELVLGLAFANMRLLKSDRNCGKGRAVQRGVLAARGRYVLFADADN